MRDATIEDVWVAAQLIWENTSKISDRDLIEQLGISFGELAPKSSGTISKRRKKEDWQKAAPLKPKKPPRKVEAKQAGSTEIWKQNDPKTKVLPSATNRVQNVEADPVLEAKKSVIVEHNDSVIMTDKQRAAIIIKSRNRLDKVGVLTDHGIRIALSVLDHIEDGDGEEIQKAIVVSDALATTVDKLARSIKLIAEVEMPLCGITPDDFTQSERERRMGALDSFGDISAEEDAARAEKQPLLMARLARLQAREDDPSFGRGTDPNLEDEDEDDEDVDYTSLDEDD